jgi:hypothetical protein
MRFRAKKTGFLRLRKSPNPQNHPPRLIPSNRHHPKQRQSLQKPRARLNLK